MITGTDKNPSFGLAADGKPANVPNGHLHVEIDTFKASLYDEENDEWYEDAGGGGSGLPDYSEASEGDVLSIDSNGDPAWAPPSGGALVVTFGGANGLTPDKTNAEIAAAATAGQLVVFKWSVEGVVFVGIADITLSNGSMTYAEAFAVNSNMGGMLSTMTHEVGVWYTTELYLGGQDSGGGEVVDDL